MAKDTQTPAPAESSAPAEHVAVVEQALKALVKLVNGRKIYAENNPRLEQFREELETTLRQFFELEDELVLTIDQFAIRWNDAVVHENVKREESLPFILFKDGIGELTLTPEAVGMETDELVDILADELHNLAGDDDVVTRFWNADFDHITYRVLDDYLANEFGAGARETDGVRRIDETSDHPELHPTLADKGRIIVNDSHTLISIDTMLRKIVDQHHPNADEREREAAYQRTLRSIFNAPAEEIAIYAQEMERERAEDGVAAFVDAILVFMLLHDNPSAVRDITSIVERLVDFAAMERNPTTLEQMARIIREFSAREDVPEGVKGICERLRGRITNPALVAALLEGTTTADARADAVLSFAAETGEPAVDALVNALHRSDQPPLHRKICDTLIAIAGEKLAEVLDRFDVDHPEIAFDAVYIARTIRVPVLTPRLRQLAFYPDARVKLDMLSWVASRTDSDSTEILLASLADLDKRVRLKVLDVLVERPEPRVREKLTEIAFGKDLAEKTPDEQEAIFRALGHVGDAHTVEQLRALVERRKIGLGKGSDAKLLALRALEKIRVDAALELVSRLAEDPNEAVRLRALRARDALAAAIASAPKTRRSSERMP